MHGGVGPDSLVTVWKQAMVDDKGKRLGSETDSDSPQSVL